MTVTPLQERISSVFASVALRPPFEATSATQIIEPTPFQLRRIEHRLREVWTAAELNAMDDSGLTQAVRRVWELVRWSTDPSQ